MNLDQEFAAILASQDVVINEVTISLSSSGKGTIVGTDTSYDDINNGDGSYSSSSFIRAYASTGFTVARAFMKFDVTGYSTVVSATLKLEPNSSGNINRIVESSQGDSLGTNIADNFVSADKNTPYSDSFDSSESIVEVELNQDAIDWINSNSVISLSMMTEIDFDENITEFEGGFANHTVTGLILEYT